jgi:hypothetical protein
MNHNFLKKSKLSSIHIISYNKCWEALAGRNLQNHDFATNGQNIQTREQMQKYRKCVHNNIRELLKKHEKVVDFYLFQESTIIRPLITPYIHKHFRELNHHSKKNYIRILYNRKYHPLKNRIIRGEFTPGRPYMIVPFRENMVIATAHFPHTQTLANKTRKHQDLTLGDCYKKIIAGMNKTVKKNDTIVLGGDFNAVKLPRMKLKGGVLRDVKSREKTCCFLKSKKNSYKWNLDHFMTNAAKTKIRVLNMKKPGSDHKPIYLTINNK